VASNATLSLAIRNSASARSVAVTGGDRLDTTLLKKDVLLVFALKIRAVVGVWSIDS
jgi:hypothetical protein